MGRLWTIVHKEFLHIIRDTRTLALVLVMPAVLLLLTGAAVMNDVTDLPMAVVDQSKTDESRRYIDRYPASGYFSIQYYVQSEQELLDLIDRDLVITGLLVPENFGRHLSTGAPTAVQLYINGANPNEAQMAQMAVETVSQAAAQEAFIKQITRVGGSSQLSLPISTHLKYLYNPDMRQLNYLVPGLMAVILQIQALLLTALAVVREREQGTMEQLIVTPIKAWELMLGKILPYVLLAFLNILLTLAIGLFYFKVPIQGSVVLLLLLSFIFILGSLGLGVLISNISKTQMQAMYLAAGIVLMPAFILSGLILPRTNMPKIVFYVGELLPVTQFLVIVRGIILKGVGAAFLWNSIWPLVVLSVVFFGASVLLFKKHLT